MANAQAPVQYNNFTRGLISEASPLNFPEGAMLAGDNLSLSRTGEVARRLGMDYEQGYAATVTNSIQTVFDNNAVISYRWDNVAEDATLSFGVIQVGSSLWFVDLTQTAPSANLMNGGSALVLNSSTIGKTISGNTPISFASANGILLFTSKEIGKPFYLEYDSAGDSFTVNAIDMKVRDIWGVDDSLAVDERPTSLTNAHEYNLKNQGWNTTQVNVGGTVTTRDPITGTQVQVGFYPSNADVMSLYRASSGSHSNYYDPKDIVSDLSGNTPAPIGKYIIDPFARGASRQTESGVTGLPVDSDAGGITDVAFFAGRAWYSGVQTSLTSGDSRSPSYNGYVFFSQVYTDNEKLGKCYQDADPTSEHISDLISTDGGTIVIPEAKKIIKLIPLTRNLLVIAENGIWDISGGESNFTADSFEINKVTDLEITSPDAVVQVEDTIAFLSDVGIYVLGSDQVSGKLSAQSITETTIQTIYNAIPSIAKSYATGHYDATARQIRWLYSDDSGYDGITERYKYNRELVFDLTLQAFFTNTVNQTGSQGPFLAGMLSTPNFVAGTDVQQVVVNGDPVQVNGEDVVITSIARSNAVSSVRYLTIIPNGTGAPSFTLSAYRDQDFLDWKTYDATGVDAFAFLETGDSTFGDGMRLKQAPFAIFHFNRTETGFESDGGTGLLPLNPSGCLAQARWDFADSTASGKYGRQFQVYRYRRNYIASGLADPFDYGQKVITTKHKLRGRGKALRVRLESEAGKDLQLLGWGLLLTGGDRV